MNDTKEDIKARFNALAQTRDKWLMRNTYYYEDQLTYFRFLIPKDSKIAELGCGTGNLVAGLNPKQGIGIDISPEMIAIARKRHPNIEFKVGDIETVDPFNEAFEYIILSDVVGLLFDIEKTFEHIRACCTEETRLIISYYNFLWEPVLKIGERIGLKMPQQHQNWLSSNDLENLLHLTNFEVVKTEIDSCFQRKFPY